MGSVAALASAANPRVLSAVELTIASQGAIQAAVASQSAQNVNRWIDIFDTANMSIEGIQQTINAMYDLALRGAAIGLSDTVRQRIYEGI